MSSYCLNEDKDIELVKDFFSLLSEPNRIKILCLLWKDDKLCVCEIAEALGLKQNLVSHHLSMFKRIQLLDSERIWISIYYKINQQNYAKLKKLVSNILNI